MQKKILCLSRSYLSHLLPAIEKKHPDAKYFHIVQNNKEKEIVEKLGGTVVLNIENVIKKNLNKTTPSWEEPKDFRLITSFFWSPIYSDRYLPHFKDREKIAFLLHKEIKNIFEIHKFDFFLSEPVAIFLSHLIFYFCKKTDARPLLWCNTYFNGYFYFSNMITISNPFRKKLMTKEERKELTHVVNSCVNGVLSDTSGPAYHHAFTKDKKRYFSYFKQRNGMASLVVNRGIIRTGIQMLRFFRALSIYYLFPIFADFISGGTYKEQLFYSRCLLTSSKSYDDIPDQFSTKNILYPLQFEPEASLLYFAPHIVDQYSLIKTILKSLPHDKILWIKEHPNQFGALGLPKWKKLKKNHPNLKFIYGLKSGRALIKKVGLVITISSSMGLDALLLNRRVLVLGDIFYQNFSGTLKILSIADLTAHLNNEENYKPRNEDNSNIQELINFGEKSYIGDPQPSGMLFTEENIERLARAIHQETSVKAI